MLKKIKNLLKEDKGQGLVEYALIIALIALVVIGVMTQLGDEVKAIFNRILNTLKLAGTNSGIN